MRDVLPPFSEEGHANSSLAGAYEHPLEIALYPGSNGPEGEPSAVLFARDAVLTHART